MKITIRSRNQITLPEEILKELDLSQGDDFIAAIKDGHLELIPAMLIPKDETYLFTPYWQEAIQQAEKELRENDLEKADSVDEMLYKLDEE
ncbi:MAG: AbrB/MazE/SpoVT family DNA-binding domain-containing protein [Candidatus Hatepunaea meridiana]|nr:AbrB/MazE/SpoVT family DNA-binding domain-containing protein [Candidatus Hatepunaea meridiana]